MRNEIEFYIYLTTITSMVFVAKPSVYKSFVLTYRVVSCGKNIKKYI